MMENKQNNYCVIMAGGIGSRFWPYSRNAKPKQFLDFFGTGKSLLQMTVERFLPLVPMENIIIVTNKQYVDIVKEQLPELKAEQATGIPKVETVVHEGPRIGRNDPCPCGSGKKYKKCCGKDA